MLGTIISITQGILCLGFVLLIHELGHLIAARIVGIRVQKFTVFLAPWFSIIRWKPGKYINFFVPAKDAHILERNNCKDDIEGFEKINPKNWKDTEYVLGWIPLGGYCKFDTQFFRKESENGPEIYPDWDIRNFNAWKRLFVTLSGCAANIILAIAVFFCFYTFSSRRDNQELVEDVFIRYSPYAKRIGFKDNDRIIQADNITIENGLFELNKIVKAKSLKIIREGDTILLKIPLCFQDCLISEKNSNKFQYFLGEYTSRPVIKKIKPESLADSLNLKKGDVILYIDTLSIGSISDLRYKSRERKENYTYLSFARPSFENGYTGEITSIFIMPKYWKDLGVEFPVTKEEYKKTLMEVDDSLRKSHNSALSAINQTTDIALFSVSSYVSDKREDGESEKIEEEKYDGIIGLFQIFPQEWNWSFWLWGVGVFSTATAIFNLLPIPGLDGGQAIFCTLEIILRRKINENILGWINAIGYLILIIWIIWVNVKGIVNLFK